MLRRISQRLGLALTVAVVTALATSMLQAGGSVAKTPTCKTKKQKASKACKKHRTPPTRTVTRTVTVTAPTPPTTGTRTLTGVFHLDPGTNDGKGSTFRMVIAGGSPERGPYFTNLNSPASDKSITPITPGTDGGLKTGAFQEPPTPAFAGNGNALANKIITPVKFFGADFSASTAAREPQTGATVPVPTITVTDGKLSGKLQAFTASWNNQYFNQGSPKPDGSTPGKTKAVTGTFDTTTQHFTLDWASTIVGGPFNGFTGVWHLEGVFVGSCT